MIIGVECRRFPAILNLLVSPGGTKMRQVLSCFAMAVIALCITSPAHADDIQTFNVSGFFEGGSIPVFSGATISPGSTIEIDVTSGNVISADVMIPGYTFDSISARVEEHGWFLLELTSTTSSFPLLELGLAETGPSLVGYDGSYLCGIGGQDAACGQGAFVSGIIVDPIASTSVALERGQLTPVPEPSAALLLGSALTTLTVIRFSGRNKSRQTRQ
jgi:hypothetical protein